MYYNEVLMTKTTMLTTILITTILLTGTSTLQQAHSMQLDDATCHDTTIIFADLVHGDDLETINNSLANDGVTLSVAIKSHAIPTAIIFDSYSGQSRDSDLQHPFTPSDDQSIGNLAIIPDNLNPPSDSGKGGTQIYTFEAPRDIISFVWIDQDTDEMVSAIAYDGPDGTGDIIEQVDFMGLGDNTQQTITMNSAFGAKSLVFDYDSSGAVTNIELECSTTEEDKDDTFLDIDKFDVNIDDGTLEVEIKTNGNIPTDGSAGLFGYGVITALNADSLPENVLALTTHLCASDSPLQSNAPNSVCPDDDVIGLLEALTGGALLDVEHDGAEFHPHILDLKQADGFCADIGSEIEVDLARSVSSGNNISPTTYDLEVTDSEIRVEDVTIDEFNAIVSGDVLQVVSFGLGATADDNGVITDLCLLDVNPADTDDD